MLRLPLVSALAIATALPAVAQTAPTTTPTPRATPAAPASQTVPAVPTTLPAAPTTQATPAAQPQSPQAQTTTASPGGTVVGGATMSPTDTIVANAAKANNLTTLVRAVQAAGLAETLAGPGPFTVFAPNDAAFNRLAPGTLDALLAPGNKPKLVKLLNYHVVAGAMKAEDLLRQAQAGGGTTTVTTVAGEPITVQTANGGLVLSDTSGNKSYITQFDVAQSNGLVHVVNGVLVPNLDNVPAAANPTPEPTPSATEASETD